MVVRRSTIFGATLALACALSGCKQPEVSPEPPPPPIVVEPDAGENPDPIPEVVPLRVTSFAPRRALADQPVQYRVMLSEPGEATWSLIDAPTGAQISSAGVITWTPTVAQAGNQVFRARAVLNAKTVEQRFELEVASIRLEATDAVDPNNPEGGSVTVDAPLSPIKGAGVSFAPGSLGSGPAIAVSISSVQNAPLPPSAQLAGLGASDLLPIELGPTGLTFSKPVTVYLPVSAAVLAKGTPEVQTYDFTTGRWEKVTILSVDAEAGIVAAQVSHFSLYVNTPASPVYALSASFGGAASACSQSLLVRSPLTVPLSQLSADSVNGYSGSASSVREVINTLPVGKALQVFSRLSVTPGNSPEAQSGWSVASAVRLDDGSLRVDVRTHQQPGAFLATPASLATTSAEVDAWLDGSRFVTSYGGADFSSGAKVQAELSLYLVDRADALTRPVNPVNPVRTDELQVAMPQPAEGLDNDCDGAINAFDPNPDGDPPPVLSGAPSSPVRTTVGGIVPFTVRTTGEPPTYAWSASDPSVQISVMGAGDNVTVRATAAGTFRVTVIASRSGASASHTWDLLVDPAGAMNTPPDCFVAASASVIRVGDTARLTAIGKDREQTAASLSYAWSTTGGQLSSGTGPEVLFMASAPGDYTVSCIANDGTADSAPGTVRISVLEASANRAPDAPFVTPYSVSLEREDGASVRQVFRAQASDPDGDPVTYRWTASPQNPPGFAFSPSGATAEFTATADGVFEFWVVAIDAALAESSRSFVKVSVRPKMTMMQDADGDGYPAGFDCNDNNPSIYPGRMEICGDGIDQDCNGSDLSALDCDADRDRYSIRDGDCADDDASRNPGATERCDGVDNNCDGVIDEKFGVGQACSAGIGACRASGTTVCNATFTATRCSAQEGAPSAEVCDGVDNDCDGVTDEVGGGGDDVNNCGGCGLVCARPSNTEATCVSGGCVAPCAAGFKDANSNPGDGCECQISNGGVEVCDGIDNDCDGVIDEDTARSFYSGPPSTLGVGACRSGVESCNDGQYVVSQSERVPSAEVCDSVDNDCDGRADQDFDVGSDANNCGACGRTCATGETCVASRCTPPTTTDGGVGGTDGGSGGTDGGQTCVPKPEVCDGIDNDCDGMIDEGCSSMPDGGTCNPMPELCGDGIDNDCNGLIDEGCEPICRPEGIACDATTPCCAGLACEVGRCVRPSADGGQTCNPMPEVCDGIDNDCDGLVDEGCSSMPDGGACNPQPEMCGDGIDNDCNGLIDEGCEPICRPEGVTCDATTPCCAGLACEAGRCVRPSADGGQTCNPMPEVCDGIDNDCDGLVDEGCSSMPDGGACNPMPEMCGDGIDNDCNGLIDEGCGGPTCRPEGVTCDATTPCCAGLACEVGRCVRPSEDGGQTCNPMPEVCDGIDNDCNGFIDEGCSSGADGGSCMSQPEFCDGFDNNCDGQIDEGCSSTDGGNICRPDGLMCVTGTDCCSGSCEGDVCGRRGECDGTPEVCDGRDNDCNGLIDEGCSSMPDGGACNPMPEMCGDGIDNDCNGLIDENCGGLDGGGGPTCRQDFEGCMFDTECCSGVCEFGRCVSPGSNDGGEGCFPQPEICDGIDNDCDGMIDEGCSSMPDGGACNPMPEMCGDGIDNDCNGLIDENCGGLDGGGGPTCRQDFEGCMVAAECCSGVCDFGRCGGGGPECRPEICGNNWDDDCDGVIDEECPVTVNPDWLRILHLDAYAFTATSGTPAYTWSVESPAIGSIDNTGLYTAGADAGFDRVIVQDSSGTSGQSWVEIVESASVLMGPSGGTFNSPMIRIELTGLANASIAVSVDSGPQQPVPTEPNGRAMYELMPQSEGSYVVTAFVSHPRGSSSSSATFVFDWTPPPAPTISSPANGANVTSLMTVTGAAEPNAAVLVRVDTKIVGHTTADSSGLFSTTIEAQRGQRWIDAFAVDMAGNSGPLAAPSLVQVQ